MRFDSVPDFSTIYWFCSVRFGSVRFGKLNFPVRRGSAFVFRARRGSVRLKSVCFRVRFRPVPEFNGSVRFGRFVSVSYSSCICLFRDLEVCTSAKHIPCRLPDTTDCNTLGVCGLLRSVSIIANRKIDSQNRCMLGECHAFAMHYKKPSCYHFIQPTPLL